MTERAFSLIELIAILIIIGILAAFALPRFSKTKEHAMGKEAIANLKLIAAAEKIYHMQANAYYPIPAGSESDISNINNQLRLSIKETNWDYSVTSTSVPDTFTARANRQDAEVPLPYKDCEYSITQSQEEPESNNTTNCP